MKLTDQLITSAIATAVVVIIGTPAHAYQIYFGEDINESASFNPPFPRLPSTPNADAARNDFLSNLAGAGTETFEGFAPGNVSSFSINFPGAGTATFQGQGIIQNVPIGATPRYPISGNQFLDIGNFVGLPTSPGFSFNSFTFSNPEAAFGFYATSLGDVLNSPTDLELTLTNGTTQSLTIPAIYNSSAVGSALYYGIIAENPNEEFTKATFKGRSSRVTDLV
ncbi:MAG: hypothetical protein KME22_23715 [Hassallia sp. WJT32-NPBG1]|jgi:hypothetical protein|nr:hypothetical protein [Hassallia sp. WJT32-NPBG1]